MRLFTTVRISSCFSLHISLFDDAITKNNRKIDRVHNYELYIATVSIKKKAVESIKTALQFSLKATRRGARMASITTTFMTSIYAIVIKRYVYKHAYEKKMILKRLALSERRYRRFRQRNDS